MDITETSEPSFPWSEYIFDSEVLSDRTLGTDRISHRSSKWGTIAHGQTTSNASTTAAQMPTRAVHRPWRDPLLVRNVRAHVVVLAVRRRGGLGMGTHGHDAEVSSRQGSALRALRWLAARRPRPHGATEGGKSAPPNEIQHSPRLNRGHGDDQTPQDALEAEGGQALALVVDHRAPRVLPLPRDQADPLLPRQTCWWR